MFINLGQTQFFVWSDILTDLEASRRTIEKEQEEINAYKRELERLKAETKEKQEKVKVIISIDSYDEEHQLTFITKQGIVKRVSLDQFESVRQNGKIAIELRDEDELIDVKLTDGNAEILIAANNGKLARFNESDVRPIGRSAAGVRGITIPQDEAVVGMAVITEEKNEILVVTEKGFGKRSLIDDYRIQIRGGMGVKTVNVTDKNGKLNTLTSVSENNDLIITTTRGVVIRMHVSDISQTGRNTQGVILMKLKDDNKIATIAVVDRQDDEVTVQPENQVEVE